MYIHAYIRMHTCVDVYICIALAIIKMQFFSSCVFWRNNKSVVFIKISPQRRSLHVYIFTARMCVCVCIQKWPSAGGVFGHSMHTHCVSHSYCSTWIFLIFRSWYIHVPYNNAWSSFTARKELLVVNTFAARKCFHFRV